MVYPTEFHRYIPAFSARILGMYIYSWLASQAVEYGTNEFCIHMNTYHREMSISIRNAIDQNLLEVQKSLEFKFHSQ